jgi:FtsH-binding integral membrane protein
MKQFCLFKIIWKDYFKELLERIRSIRTSERRIYQQLQINFVIKLSIFNYIWNRVIVFCLYYFFMLKLIYYILIIKTMFDILFARTFTIVWVMLLITAYSSFMNKKVDAKSGWWTIIMSFALLFAVMAFSNSFPINLILVWLFAAVMGWMIAPGIRSMWDNFKTKKFLKQKWIVLKKWEQLTEEQALELIAYLEENKSDEQWNRIVSQAMFSTALAVFSTASLVFVSDIDFSFLWLVLFISLLILIIMWLLNIFIFKSRIFSLVKAYFWVLIFTLYLIYDFNTLEKMAWDDSWWTAVNLAVNIYLDIINLFLYLLEILWGDN